MCLNDLNQTFLYIDASEGLPQACMPDSVKRFLEVYEVVEQTALVTRLLKICSTVLRPGLKPARSSASSSFALALSWLRVTLSVILQGD